MRTHEIMTQPVVCISPDATLEEASQKMAENEIGDLPVCQKEKLVGMLTDRDIVVRSLAKGLDPRSTKVEEIMTSGIQYCFDDDDVDRIVRRMEEKCVRRMVVIDHNKKLIGIISLGDIAMRADESLAAEALHRISELRRSRLEQSMEPEQPEE